VRQRLTVSSGYGVSHGIETPNIIHTNTLAENISNIQNKDRYDVIRIAPTLLDTSQPYKMAVGEVSMNYPHLRLLLREGSRSPDGVCIAGQTKSIRKSGFGERSVIGPMRSLRF